MDRQDNLRHALLSARQSLEDQLAAADTPADETAIEKELTALKRCMDRLLDKHVGAADAACGRILEQLAV
jgi:hypothetical protein